MDWTLVIGICAAAILVVLALVLFIHRYNQGYAVPHAYSTLSLILITIAGEIPLAIGLEVGVVGMLRDRGLVPEHFSPAAVPWVTALNVALVCAGLVALSIALTLRIRLLRRPRR